MNNIKQIFKIEPGGEQKNHIKDTTKKAWQQLTNENKKRKRLVESNKLYDQIISHLLR
mgnify:CR=1 FL=1